VLRSIVFALALSSAAASAQQAMTARTLVESVEQHGTSGTSIEPASAPVPMLMTTRDDWRLMLHGNAFVADTQQQGGSPAGTFERGRDAFFSTNWIMPMAQRSLGDNGRFGELTLRAMFSLEPATISHRNYPELFQQGETAYGAPIVDGQHPHDLFMEVAALYDIKPSQHALLSFYAAPVGDPAIGPTAYPHRLSASEDPIAPLGHHQQDSTHIAFNVLTGGLTFRAVRVEFSGFHGAEPTESRWSFAPSPNGHAIDSVATRLTISPAADWTGQYSIARIHSPEALYPNEDQQRQTASVMYHHAFGLHSDNAMPAMHMSGMDESGSSSSSAMPMESEPRTDIATTLLWGRTRSLTGNSPTSGKENSYLAEALLRFARTNYLWTRMENAGRSNELLLAPGTPLPQGFVEQPLGHVAAYTAGYDHDLSLGPHLLAAPGAQFTIYRTPGGLPSVYGATPTAEQIFVRFRLR
jgi:hypothetical protein